MPTNDLRPTYQALKAYRSKIGAPFFTKPFDLNLLIARSGNVGQWDDYACFAFTDFSGRAHVEAFICTSDASETEWTDPTHPEGCIFVLDQHVPGGYALGKHKGRVALVQSAPFRYVRWPKTKGYVPSVFELETLAMQGAGFKGVRGTNMHNRASNNTPAKPAKDDSEGCPVFLLQHQYVSALELVKMQEREHGSSSVSPTFCKLADVGL